MDLKDLPTSIPYTDSYMVLVLEHYFYSVPEERRIIKIFEQYLSSSIEHYGTLKNAFYYLCSHEPQFLQPAMWVLQSVDKSPQQIVGPDGGPYYLLDGVSKHNVADTGGSIPSDYGYWEGDERDPPDGEDQIEAEQSKSKLTVQDINKPVDKLNQDQIDKIWEITKGICGG